MARVGRDEPPACIPCRPERPGDSTKNNGAACNYPASYTSPYTITYTCNAASLTTAFDTSPRNDVALESTMPYANWYDQAAYSSVERTWGSPPTQYPPVSVPADAGCSPLKWKRERLVATAARYIGRYYQHHHIPDWEPPSDWPYSETLINGEISHVILWVGSLGSGPDPLVIDSHDNSPVVYDSDNVAIPLGVHLRPFRKTEWYYTSFSHALRILPSGETTAPATGLLLLNGQ